MNFRILGLLGALLIAAPVAAVAAPASGVTAHNYATLVAPATTPDAAPAAKMEKAYFYVRRFYRFRPYYRYRFYRPYRYYYRPFVYRRFFFRRRFFY